MCVCVRACASFWICCAVVTPSSSSYSCHDDTRKEELEGARTISENLAPQTLPGELRTWAEQQESRGNLKPQNQHMSLCLTPHSPQAQPAKVSIIQSTTPEIEKSIIYKYKQTNFKKYIYIYTYICKAMTLCASTWGRHLAKRPSRRSRCSC